MVGYQGPFLCVGGIFQSPFLERFGDPLAHVQKRGDTSSNVEGGWGKIPRLMNWCSLGWEIPKAICKGCGRFKQPFLEEVVRDTWIQGWGSCE